MVESTKGAEAPIDWANVPAPTTFCTSTLVQKATGPGRIDTFGFTVRGTPASRKGHSLSWPATLYYIRQAALKWPKVRTLLDEMVASLPPRST